MVVDDFYEDVLDHIRFKIIQSFLFLVEIFIILQNVTMEDNFDEGSKL